MRFSDFQKAECPVDFEKLFPSFAPTIPTRKLVTFDTDYVKRIFVDEQEKVIVVKFLDNTIEKVKCSEEDDFDINVGVAIAIARHVFGSHSNYYKKILGKVTYTKKAESTEYEKYIKWCKETKTRRLVSESTFKKNKAKYLSKMEGEK